MKGGSWGGGLGDRETSGSDEGGVGVVTFHLVSHDLSNIKFLTYQCASLSINGHVEDKRRNCVYIFSKNTHTKHEYIPLTLRVML